MAGPLDFLFGKGALDKASKTGDTSTTSTPNTSSSGPMPDYSAQAEIQKKQASQQNVPAKPKPAAKVVKPPSPQQILGSKNGK